MVRNNVQAVVLDWAGTTVDYGCFAPLGVFVELFRSRDIDVTIREARQPMGLPKRDHIRELCRMERIAAQWRERFGRLPAEDDVEALHARFAAELLRRVGDYAELIPGALDAVVQLRASGVAIGSTTGYAAETMQLVARAAKQQGYAPDCIVTPDDVPQGRPYPWMCYANAMRLGVYPMSAMAKVGDTVADIHEGRNAGMWTIGIVLGSSELGMTRDEVAAADDAALRDRCEEVRRRYMREGAHEVIESIGRLPAAIEQINRRIGEGECPHDVRS